MNMESIAKHYLSYPMTTMVRSEAVPQMAPTHAYNLQAKAPYIQYLQK